MRNMSNKALDILCALTENAGKCHNNQFGNVNLALKRLIDWLFRVSLNFCSPLLLQTLR